MVWELAQERPGYFGRRRDERYAEFDQCYGTGRWRLAWQIGERIGGFAEVVAVYEDAYYRWLRRHSELLDWLVREAGDVYDDAPSNVGSGLDYWQQETNRTHLQDVALRRCMVRFGRRFAGARLLQIRDDAADPPVHPLSMLLSPGRVPFHHPEWIRQPGLPGWWDPGTVECWYQSNKLLQVWCD